MTRAGLALVAVMLAVASAGSAEAPPPPRPEAEAPPPRPEPSEAAPQAPAEAPPARPAPPEPAPQAGPETPPVRPEPPGPVERPATPGAAAALCGDPTLTGAAVPAIVGEGGCGIAAPVRVDTAAGVALDPAPTLDCSAAQALSKWLSEDVAPAFAGRGGPVTGLTVLDAYSCRNRNRAASGKLSEHGRGRAIDVGAFRLGNGEAVTVREGWASTDWGPVLRRVHDAACGPFSTVLGPEANALHADHLHLDTEERKRGPWCE